MRLLGDLYSYSDTNTRLECDATKVQVLLSMCPVLRCFQNPTRKRIMTVTGFFER
jgi:hypothetical protein